MKGLFGKFFWFTANAVSIVLLFGLMQSLTNTPNTTIVAGSKTNNSIILGGELSTPDLVNKYRLSNSLTPLSANPRLIEVANQRADEMVELGYFAHENPFGNTYYDILSSSGNAPANACENLFLGYSTDPEVIFEGWKQSMGHNKCMLNNNVNEFGYAIREFGTSFDEFGTPKNHYIAVMIHASDE